MADRMAERGAAAAAALAERDAALAAKIEGLVKAISQSVDTKIRKPLRVYGWEDGPS